MWVVLFASVVAVFFCFILFYFCSGIPAPEASGHLAKLFYFVVDFLLSQLLFPRVAIDRMREIHPTRASLSHVGGGVLCCVWEGGLFFFFFLC